MVVVASGALVVNLCVLRPCTFKFIVNSYLNLSVFNCVQWLSFRQWHHSLLFDIVKYALDVNDSNEGLEHIILLGFDEAIKLMCGVTVY